MIHPPPGATSVARRLVVAMALLATAACAGSARLRQAPEPGIMADAAPSGARLIPTRYAADRFFATPVTERGDTMTLLLDTGDQSRIFSGAAARLGIVTTDTANTPQGRHLVAPLPPFRAGRTIPDVGPLPGGAGPRVIITDPLDGFDTLMSSAAAGQLGRQWFADRIWTFDYPHHRLLLNAKSPPVDAATHVVPVDFPTDTAGRRLNSTPRIAVSVDGDSLVLLFDTGATVWLTDAAMARLQDDQPRERASSLVRQTIFARWRKQHPEWRVLEHANQMDGADMIEVPVVRIAGFDVGPVWFASLPDKRWPAVMPARVRFDGTLGGSALKYFVVTLDFPASTAQFTRPG